MQKNTISYNFASGAKLAQPTKLEQYGTLQFSKGSTGYDHLAHWLVEECIPSKSFGTLFGPSGAKKTFLAIDIACSIASDTAWCEKSVDSGAVVFIAGEGNHGISQRIKAWEITNKQSADNLFVLGHSLFLSEKPVQEQLITSIKHLEKHNNTKVKLIVLDTLARCFIGDENSSRDMNEFVAACDHVRNAIDCSCLCIHHKGKDVNRGARGSSVLRAACDYEFYVKRSANNKSLILDNTKQKEASEMPSIEIEMETIDIGITCESNRPITSLARVKIPIQIAKSDTVEHPVLHLLKEDFQGTANRGELRKALYPEPLSAAQRKSFSRSLQSLQESKIITISLVGYKASDSDVTHL